MEDNHLELAILRVNQARDKSHRQVDSTVEELASLATAHAVLALLDYLQGQDSVSEPAFDSMSPQVIVLQNRIRHLEEDLEGARAALRARDAEITIEANRGNKRE